MICLRFLGGLGEGALYLGHVYLARLSSPDQRTRIFGYWELGTAAGLVGGPAIASALAGSAWNDLLPGTGELMTLSVAAAAAVLLLLVSALFPSSAQLSISGKEMLPVAPVLAAKEWTVQLTLSGSTVVRLLLRLAWEAAAWIVLATHFCLGHEKSGYGITATFCLYMAGQGVFVLLCQHYSDHQMIRSCECLELLGLVLMFRMPSDVETTLMEDVMGSSAFVRLGLFLLGSAFFYTGNCLTSAPLSSWATKHGPRSETVMLSAHLAIQSGVCAGGLLSRIFTSMDPHQNMIVAMLLPVVCMQIVLSELGIGLTGVAEEVGAKE
ncbi:unnamed protein product [Effrenium voratum]|uniref:Uncharacterized protein n=1 Tax=Effrenium voratum TaxID=2562239 RepID=A0AA36NEG0_9DINO|nr:unnamed protein product [Effrenium voratum]